VAAAAIGTSDIDAAATEDAGREAFLSEGAASSPESAWVCFFGVRQVTHLCWRLYSVDVIGVAQPPHARWRPIEHDRAVRIQATHSKHHERSIHCVEMLGADERAIWYLSMRTWRPRPFGRRGRSETLIDNKNACSNDLHRGARSVHRDECDARGEME
jgi:hypothetical protein